MNVDQQTSSMGFWDAHCSKRFVRLCMEDGYLWEVCNRIMVHSVRDLRSKYMEGIRSMKRDRVEDRLTGRQDRSSRIQGRLPNRRSNDCI